MERIAAILAGGKSRRMGECDKALARLGDRRLVDYVIEGLRPQVDRILISGSSDYGTMLQTISDSPTAPLGPVGGVYTICEWLKANNPYSAGFFTAPVDAPFAPHDLILRLGECGAAAIASDGENDHPTFAYWTVKGLTHAFKKLNNTTSISLKALADACDARRIIWGDANAFANVNTPKDLTDAQMRLVGRVRC